MAVDIDVGQAPSPSALCQTMHLLDCQYGGATTRWAPCSLLDIARCCCPLVAFGTLPEQLRMRTAIDSGHTLATSALCQTMHLLNRQSGRPTALRAPFAVLDVVRCCSPFVAISTSPSQLRTRVDIDVRETLAAAGLGELVHCIDCQLGEPGALAAPCPLLDMVRCCRPLMAFGALPSQPRIRIDIDARETLAASTLGKLMH